MSQSKKGTRRLRITSRKVHYTVDQKSSNTSQREITIQIESKNQTICVFDNIAGGL